MALNLKQPFVHTHSSSLIHMHISPLPKGSRPTTVLPQSTPNFPVWLYNIHPPLHLKPFQPPPRNPSP